MKDIVLIHRNVRMFDNPALFHGSKNQDYGVVYLYDQNYWQANGKSKIQLNFLFDCLKNLDQKVEQFYGLAVRHTGRMVKYIPTTAPHWVTRVRV